MLFLFASVDSMKVSMASSGNLAVPDRPPGTYSLDATQIWRAETWRVEDDDMTHLPEVKKEAPWKGRLKGKVPGSPLHFVQTESHKKRH